jgi:hypothetical protein
VRLVLPVDRATVGSAPELPGEFIDARSDTSGPSGIASGDRGCCADDLDHEHRRRDAIGETGLEPAARMFSPQLRAACSWAHGLLRDALGVSCRARAEGAYAEACDAQATTQPGSSRRPDAIRLPPPPACVETALPRLRRALEPARAAGARARRAARRTRPAEDDRASRLGPARGRGALSPRPPRPLPSSLLRLEADQPGAASRAGADMGGREGAADPRPITTPVVPLGSASGPGLTLRPRAVGRRSRTCGAVRRVAGDDAEHANREAGIREPKKSPRR